MTNVTALERTSLHSPTHQNDETKAKHHVVPWLVPVSDELTTGSSSGLTGADFKRGLALSEFFLVYQPQFAISPNGQELSGVEALLRWKHPTLGNLAPAQFTHCRAFAHLECEIGEYVLHTALKQIRSWLNAAGWSPKVAINLSAEQLDSSALPRTILNALKAWCVEPNLLKVEIMESPAILNIGRAAGVLRTLRDAGINVAIDDFGKGCASFQYLLSYPFDSIKICSAFVQGIGQGAGSDEVCKAIIQLGHSLSKQIIAEGVETREQLEFLRAHHCHEVQGFFLARPCVGEAFTSLYMNCRTVILEC